MGENRTKRYFGYMKDICVRICQVGISGYRGEHIQMSYEVTQQTLHTTIAAVKQEVDNHFDQQLSLTQIARRYHYNEKYLGILFKKQVGFSFRDYLNQCRMAAAVQMLQYGQCNVKDVALRSGFNNVTYFNRVFKRQYGITPTEYRNVQKK